MVIGVVNQLNWLWAPILHLSTNSSGPLSVFFGVEVVHFLWKSRRCDLILPRAGTKVISTAIGIKICPKILKWLVVWTPLKNISQLGWLFPIYGKIKFMATKPPTSEVVLPSGWWSPPKLKSSNQVLSYGHRSTWSAILNPSNWGAFHVAET